MHRTQRERCLRDVRKSRLTHSIIPRNDQWIYIRCAMESHIFSISLSNRPQRLRLWGLALFSVCLFNGPSRCVYRKFNWKDTPRPQKVRRIRHRRITNPFFSLDFQFSRAFSSSCRLPFFLGRTMFNVPIYDFLSFTYHYYSSEIYSRLSIWKASACMHAVIRALSSPWPDNISYGDDNKLWRRLIIIVINEVLFLRLTTPSSPSTNQIAVEVFAAKKWQVLCHFCWTKGIKYFTESMQIATTSRRCAAISIIPISFSPSFWARSFSDYIMV